VTSLCNAVFEGGGVKGIGLVGGICGLENAGYRFENVAGTSAGAIVASLLAVGYTGTEIKEEMLKLNFTKFQGRSFLNKLGIPGKIIKLALSNGIYDADYLEEWLEGLFKRKGKTRFGDIRLPDAHKEKYMYRFQAIASDLSDSRMLVLPRDLSLFGINPDQFRISRAVRMSMNIPLFYKPYVLTDVDGRKHLIVDGGLLSNYPIWLLDSRAQNPPHPTFGLKFCSPNRVEDAGGFEYREIRWLPDFLKALTQTSMEAHDRRYISLSKGDYQRTIAISPVIMQNKKQKAVSTVDFALKEDAKLELFNNGFNAAKIFLETWNFEDWKSSFRNTIRRKDAK